MRPKCQVYSIRLEDFKRIISMRVRDLVSMFWPKAAILIAMIACSIPALTYASAPISGDNTISTAEDVHLSESMKIPPSVGTFVILIPNEAHENWSDEKHKLITDKNSYYAPNLGLRFVNNLWPL
jgi:hypothetical protein